MSALAPLPNPPVAVTAAGPRPGPRRPDPERGTPALVVLEEAVHLLRFAPVRVRTFYLTGTVPFLLGFLYFWADMTRNVNAELHLAPASLGLTLLFVWMKCWQSAAASELHAHCAGASLAPWNWARARRLAYIQMLIQPWKLVVLPIAALLTLPFGAACAFFHTVAIHGDGTMPIEEVRRRARAAATPWPAQNFMGLMWIALGGLFIFFNVYILGLLLPQLFRIFTGVETDATQSGTAFIFNSTFFAAALAGAHLFLFALTGAFYTVRCFRAQSRHDGRDLLRALDLARAARALAERAVAVFLLTAFLLPAPALQAAFTAPPPAASPATPRSGREAQLDQALKDVFERREFAWRIPRGGREGVERSETALDRFFGSIGKWMRGVFRTIEDWWRGFREWMRRMQPEREIDLRSGSSGGWAGAMAAQPLLYALLALVLLVAGWVAWKQWQGRQRRRVVSAEAAIPAAAAVTDLEDEAVLASQLPEDDWLRMANELEAQGEYRLALRALFLCGLATLASRGAVLIARHKSNRDYQREIERRGRNRAEWTPAFADGVRIFERSWYGEHPAGADTLAGFRRVLEVLKREAAVTPMPVLPMQTSPAPA